MSGLSKYAIGAIGALFIVAIVIAVTNQEADDNLATTSPTPVPTTTSTITPMPSQENENITPTPDVASDTDGEPATPTEQPVPTDTNGASNTVTIDITGRNYSYSPNSIEVSTGSQVTFVFNSAQGDHDFVIDGLDIRTNILSAGEEQEVTFFADTPGTYTFYCSVGNHRALGMEGTLVITE